MNRRLYLKTATAIGFPAILAGCIDSQPIIGETTSTTDIRNASTEVNYEELYRNISDYQNAAVHYTNLRISDVLSGEGVKEYLFVFEQDDVNTDRVLYGTWNGDPYRRNDEVEIWGVVQGMETFESWTGDKTVPKIAVKEMELR